MIGLTVIDGNATWSSGTKYDVSIYDIKFLDNNPSITADSNTWKSRPVFGNGLSSCQRYLLTNVNSFENNSPGFNPDFEYSAAYEKIFLSKLQFLSLTQSESASSGSSGLSSSSVLIINVQSCLLFPCLLELIFVT